MQSLSFAFQDAGGFLEAVVQFLGSFIDRRRFGGFNGFFEDFDLGDFDLLGFPASHTWTHTQWL